MMSTRVQERVVYQLKRAEQALRAAIDEALAPLGLTSAQYGVLAALSAASGATSAELARACLVSAQSMHELTSVLAGRGLIDRARRDGRSLHLDLTPTGRQLLDTADPVVDRVEREVLGTPSDLDEVQSTLTALVTRLTRQPGT